MGDKSAIEWTDATWNPVTGCTKVSPACANCYIERQTPMRVAGRRFIKGHIPLEFHENRLDAPLKRQKPTMYFVNSMSDLFHEGVPDTFIDRVFAVMALAPQHTFQVLTKRPERMRDYMNGLSRYPDGHCWEGALRSFRVFVAKDTLKSVDLPLRNVWLGVSVENQHFADERIPLLLQAPAAVRFLSCEPLLSRVDLAFAVENPRPVAVRGEQMPALAGLDWVIVGGESGPRLRPTKPEWVRSIRDQCVSAGVPFFFKQWGGRTPKSGGRLLDGREWSEYPGVNKDNPLAEM